MKREDQGLSETKAVSERLFHLWLFLKGAQEETPTRKLRVGESPKSSTFVNFSRRLSGTLFALILKGKAAIGHLYPAGSQKMAHPFFFQHLHRDMRIAMIAESQKPSTFVNPHPKDVRAGKGLFGVKKPFR
jgi:hypothetical protein